MVGIWLRTQCPPSLCASPNYAGNSLRCDSARRTVVALGLRFGQGITNAAANIALTPNAKPIRTPIQKGVISHTPQESWTWR